MDFVSSENLTWLDLENFQIALWLLPEGGGIAHFYVHAVVMSQLKLRGRAMGLHNSISDINGVSEKD